MRQLFDIESTRSDLGRHQRGNLVVLEISERTSARVLALVAMDGRSTNTIGLELLGQTIGAVFGSREHQHLVPVPVIDQVSQQMPLVLLRYTVDLLVHPLRG